MCSRMCVFISYLPLGAEMGDPLPSGMASGMATQKLTVKAIHDVVTLEYMVMLDGG